MDIKVDDEVELLAHKVIGAAIEVHRELGPGLPEQAYERALSRELTLRGLAHEQQKCIQILYKGEEVGECRLDFLVAGKLVVELKSVEKIIDIHKGQVVSYLRLTNQRLGLLINFNVMLLKDGISRIIL